MQIFTTKMVITNKSGISHSRSPLGDFFIQKQKGNKFMKINTRLIEKSLLEVKNDILDICTNENITLSYFEPRITNIERCISILDSISLFIDDLVFIKEFTALNIVPKRILSNQNEFLESKDFRKLQINSLNYMGINFN